MSIKFKLDRGGTKIKDGWGVRILELFVILVAAKCMSKPARCASDSVAQVLGRR